MTCPRQTCPRQDWNLRPTAQEATTGCPGGANWCADLRVSGGDVRLPARGHRSRCGSADRITSWQPYRSSSGAPRMSEISSRTRESARGT